MHAVARRAAHAIVFLLSVVLILLVAGLEFVRRPVGLACLVLWVALAVATAVFRRPGEPSKYDRSQIAWRSVLGVFDFLAILVLGP